MSDCEQGYARQRPAARGGGIPRDKPRGMSVYRHPARSWLGIFV